VQQPLKLLEGGFRRMQGNNAKDAKKRELQVTNVKDIRVFARTRVIAELVLSEERIWRNSLM
jgi:hypothetical protein